MLRQGSVDQVRHQTLPRANSLIVITMCHYPRGIRKEWRDEFRSDLAPDRLLFKEWKSFEQVEGHDQAFALARYEQRFHLSPIALAHLAELSVQSHTKDIYLVCQCQVGERCHREMLLLLAQKLYGAAAESIFNSYPVFENRIQKGQL